ncbi:NACHT domain-containing protein [Sorangium sp. So ce145]|uniref:NACHT domain-containing protein n=1 Tax=Sorangium sp. So ce145 TaxID=3133285 RepID=UPI003F6295D1
MHVRIVDRPGAGEREDAIDISIERPAGKETFAASANAALAGAELDARLAWYFAEYPQTTALPPDDRGVASAIADVGRAMGERLANGEERPAALASAIGEREPRRVGVLIESSRASFLAAPWELMVLPGADQPWSTLAAHFVRRFHRAGRSEDDSQIAYELGVTPPEPEAVAALKAQMRGDAPAPQPPPDAPLRILHVVSRALRDLLPFASSHALEWAAESLGAEGAVDYEIFPAGWAELQARLVDRRRPVHVLHYDGPIVLDGGIASVLLGGPDGPFERVAVAELAWALVRSKVAALAVDTRGAFDGAHPVAVPAAVSAVASAARDASLGNVIAAAYAADPWTSGRCFQEVYTRLAAGLTLGEAVVDARRALCERAEASRFTSEPRPFHAWPLLVHYGGQSVSFFAQAQARASLEESQALARARRRLLGFHATLLPPLLRHAGDGVAVAALGAIARGRRAIALTGEPGAGKSHAAHRVALYLAQRDAVDFAFYFDFGAEPYSVDDILEMIAPVLGLAPDRKAETRVALAKLRCCFALDDVDRAAHRANGAPGAAAGPLLEFVRELLAAGHVVVTIGATKAAALAPDFVELPVAPLSADEQQALAADELRARDLQGRDRDADWPALLAATRGHPFLLERAVRLLRDGSVRGVADGVRSRVPTGHAPVEAFYGWQWAEMPQPWRSLLLACAQVDGLLLEILMVAVDQKTPFAPAKRLLARLGDESAVFSQGLALWERRGFLVRLPHGRMIDPRCRAFLELAGRSERWDGGSADAELELSQTLCEGLRILSAHLQGRANPALTHYLLMNRRHWVAHFERLWFAGDLRGFLGVMHAFNQLLRQAQLGAEGAAWSLRLVQRSPVPDVDGEAPPEASLAWLVVALQALGASGAAADRALCEGAAAWQRWLDALPEPIELRRARQFQQVATFLDALYRARQDWATAIAVDEKAHRFYKRIGAWPAAVQALRSLARCHVELGDAGAALRLEDEILHDIPYADAPPGFQAQQLFDVAVARAARGAFAGAQSALDRLKAMDDAKRFGDSLEALQADVRYEQGSYADALRDYCALWTRALETQQAPFVERLRTRLLDLRGKLGEKEFERRIERELPEGIARP